MIVQANNSPAGPASGSATGPASGPASGSSTPAAEAAEELRLQEAPGVRALLDPLTRQVLAVFCGRAVETAVAARELRWSTERTAHHVARLHRLGVLREVSRREHSGRAVITWAAPAVLRGSLDLLPETDVTAVFDEVDAAGRRPFLQALARAAVQRGMLSWDVVVHRAEGDGSGDADGDADADADADAGGRTDAQPHAGGLRLSVSPAGTRWMPGDPTPDAGGAPAVVLSWLPLAMTPDQAARLQRLLLQLAAEQPIATEAPTHLCGLFLTPLSP